MRYRFQGLYELDSLAVVNVRDAGPNKNAFKIDPDVSRLQDVSGRQLQVQGSQNVSSFPR